MTPGRLPAIILVLAFLACHGLFGAAHEASMPASESHGINMPAYMQMGDTGGSCDGHQTSYHETGHVAGGAAYNAVLVTVLLGMAFWLLRGVRGWGTASGLLPAVPEIHIGPVRLHPPRGPTLPSLQVLRL